MIFLISIPIALRALIANKMRAALTMLGIVIGVGAVIALVAAGAGTQAQVTERFESLGSNLLVISSRQMFFRGVSQGTSSQSLTNDDVEAIAKLARYISAIAPEYSTQQQIVYRNNNTQTSVLGVTPSYQTVREYQVARGRFIKSLDLTYKAKVAVLGSTVVEDLFGELVNPLGKYIKINRENYEVVGILESKGASGIENLDNHVFIPLTTAQLKFGGAGNKNLQAINIQVTDVEKMDAVETELTAIMRVRHGLSGTQSNDFMIQNQTQMVETIQETTATFTVLLASIAAISLLVGGIGVMNIMLVSVTERTREIGLRKAVGARKSDIMAQFLVEAMALCLLGGLMGVIVGYGGAQIITPLLGANRAIITPESVAIALGVSIGVGVFFGLYPAGRAAAWKPIDALRYE